MGAYSINVLLSVYPFVLGMIGAMFIGFAVYFAKYKKLGIAWEEFKKILYPYLIPAYAVVLVIVTFLAMVSHSNRYMHTTHDKQELNMQYEAQIMQKEAPEKKDTILKPNMTKEEREAHFKELMNFK